MIPTADVREAAAIARLAADLLLATSNEQKGASGSGLRRACGDMKSNADVYIVQNVIAGKLATCFDQARLTGATLSELNRIRETIIAVPDAPPWKQNHFYAAGQSAMDSNDNVVYKSMISHTSPASGSFSAAREAHPNNWGDPLSLVAAVIKNGCINFCLQQMSMVIVDTVYTSRNDVEIIRDEINIAFNQAEDNAADEMILTVYRTLIALHAAVTFHLYETARPLPQMLRYAFATPRPTLILSHRLYTTARRADELRKENKVVHPAFAPREGRALAF